ncbi:MAG: inositol monophosphatase family protein [bacterium]|nr:inositol monophosphatase family protein [bacterium]
MTKDEKILYLEAAMKAAVIAGKEILAAQGGENKVEYKGEIDLVTEMDLRAEEIIKDFLSSGFPDVAILAEESGLSGSDSNIRWIIDPIDGTTGYAHGIPHFAVSIGLEREGMLEIGAVYNPPLKECFSAIKGGGAFLNGRAIGVSDTKELKRSLLATGFSCDRATSAENNVAQFNAFLMKAQGIRRFGSAALDLCYTAAGRFDGYWEMKLKPWDTAAGILILTEAGGKVTDFKGGGYSIYDDRLLCSNGHIHDQMIDILKGA